MAPDDDRAVDGTKTDVVRFDDALLDEVLRSDPDAAGLTDESGAEAAAETTARRPRVSRAVLGVGAAVLVLLATSSR